jgi:hypothetical protein
MVRSGSAPAGAPDTALPAVVSRTSSFQLKSVFLLRAPQWRRAGTTISFC